MGALFIKLSNMSIAASWLILAVIILRAPLKKAPKWIRCILWGIVAVRLVCPFSFESAMSLIPSEQTIPARILTGPTFEVNTGIAKIDATVNEYLGDTYFEGVSAPVNNGYRIISACSAIWIVGLGCLLLYALASFLRLHRKVSEAVLLRENVWEADAVKSPFILGIISPQIYVSSSVGENQLNYILAHEQAHIKRKDHIWKFLGYLLLSVYWFNPLSWAAYILFCRDIELACDEKVVCGYDEDEKVDYSKALLSCSMQRKLVMSCPLAFGEVAVKERVKSVLRYQKPAFWLLCASVIVCIVVAVCFLTVSPKTYQIKVTIPAGGADPVYYSDTEISPKGKVLTVYAGEGMGDGEIEIEPVEVREENAYDETWYITPGMPVKIDVEKGAWFKIGVNAMQNDSGEDITVYLSIANIDVRIAAAGNAEDMQTEQTHIEDDMQAERTHTAEEEKPEEGTEENMSLAPDYEKVTEIVITNGNNGEQKTFRITDSDNGFRDLLHLYGQLNFAADTEENSRFGYSYSMKLCDAEGKALHTVTPYKDGFSMDGLFYKYTGAQGLDEPSVNLRNCMELIFYPPKNQADVVFLYCPGRL